MRSRKTFASSSTSNVASGRIPATEKPRAFSAASPRDTASSRVTLKSIEASGKAREKPARPTAAPTTITARQAAMKRRSRRSKRTGAPGRAALIRPRSGPRAARGTRSHASRSSLPEPAPVLTPRSIPSIPTSASASSPAVQFRDARYALWRTNGWPSSGSAGSPGLGVLSAGRMRSANVR